MVVASPAARDYFVMGDWRRWEGEEEDGKEEEGEEGGYV